MNEYSTEPLDSCDTGLIAEEGSEAETVGDHLCQRAFDLYKVGQNIDSWVARRAYSRNLAPNFMSSLSLSFKFGEDKPKFWYIALVEIGAYVSYCGSKWQGRKEL